MQPLLETFYTRKKRKKERMKRMNEKETKQELLRIFNDS